MVPLGHALRSLTQNYHAECSGAQSGPAVCDPMDDSLPGCSVHGIFQARILEWVAMSYFRASSRSTDRTRISCVSCNGRQILYHLATWEAQELPCDPTILLPSKYPKEQYHRKGNQWIQGLAALTQTISEGKSQMTVTQQVTEGNQSRLT